MKAKEDHQRQLRLDTLKKNLEVNLRNKQLYKSTAFIDDSNAHTTNDGLQRMFANHQIMSLQRKRQIADNANLQKDMMV